MTTVPPFDEYTVRDAKTGEVRKDHTHPYCTIGAELSDSGDYFSHDHYCMAATDRCVYCARCGTADELYDEHVSGDHCKQSIPRSGRKSE